MTTTKLRVASLDLQDQLEDISVRLSVLKALCWHLSNAHESEDADTANLDKVFHHIAESVSREELAIDGIVQGFLKQGRAAAGCAPEAA
jgi:hypothetical protein